MNWFQKNKKKLIAGAAIVAVLAFAFWYGGDAPGLKGWKVDKNPSSNPQEQTEIAEKTQQKDPLQVAENTETSNPEKQSEGTPKQDEKQPETPPKQDEKQPETPSKQDEKQPETPSKQDEKQPETPTKQDEKQPETPSKQDEKQPETPPKQDEKQPETPSKQDEKQPETPPKQDEKQPENPPKQDEKQPENPPKQDEKQPETPPKQDVEQPETPPKQDEEEPEEPPKQDIDPETGKDKYQTDPVPEGKPLPVEPEDQEPSGKTLHCTFSISCATILDNMEYCEEEKKQCVPEDGWILKPTTVEFKEGENVYDVLSKICKKKGIQMEASFTPMYNSVYVEGINNLYEFDVGNLSGWMYKVNGWFPNYGASRYVLQDGDVCCWVYTCDLGYDVGGGYAVGGE